MIRPPRGSTPVNGYTYSQNDVGLSLRYRFVGEMSIEKVLVGVNKSWKGETEIFPALRHLLDNNFNIS